MKALGYGIYLQWKMDIRSRSLLITCYLVPLLFFLMMGSVFTSIMPESQETLMASMTVMGVSMGAYIGLPPSIDVYKRQSHDINVEMTSCSEINISCYIDRDDVKRAQVLLHEAFLG